MSALLKSPHEKWLLLILFLRHIPSLVECICSWFAIPARALSFTLNSMLSMLSINGSIIKFMHNSTKFFELVNTYTFTVKPGLFAVSIFIMFLSNFLNLLLYINLFHWLISTHAFVFQLLRFLFLDKFNCLMLLVEYFYLLLDFFIFAIRIEGLSIYSIDNFSKLCLVYFDGAWVDSSCSG